MTVVACFMINVEHLKEQSTTEIWTFQNPFKGFLSPLFFFFPLSFTKTCLSCLQPLSVPHIPLPAPITESWGLGIGLEL